MEDEGVAPGRQRPVVDRTAGPALDDAAVREDAADERGHDRRAPRPREEDEQPAHPGAMPSGKGSETLPSRRVHPIGRQR
jgi:hypothetical protein